MARPHIPSLGEPTDRLDILGGLSEDDVRDWPFPHVSTAPCIDLDLFARLSESMPVPAFRPDSPSNMLTLANPFEPPLNTRLSEDWKRFAAHHASSDFFASILRVIGSRIRKIHPELEGRLGRKLEDARCVWRGSEQAGDADFLIECQLGYNSPVREQSSVRGPHVDKTRRLVSALLYMPEPGDDAGGEITLYRFKRQPKFNGVSADLADVDPISTIPYEPNRLILFVNGPNSVHGVQPRKVTNRIRRYVNFFVDYREPLFALD